MQITIDTEFKNLIPALLPEEYKQLEANIIRDGCHEPLSLWKDGERLILIDGHNRKRICEKNDIAFNTKQLKFDSRDHVIVWICERQLGRRNLTDDVRAVIGHEKEERLAAITTREQRAEAGRESGKVRSGTKTNGVNTVITPLKKERVRAKVAKEANVSERKLQYAKTIKDKAPEVVGMVRSGQVSLVEGKKIAALEPTARKKVIAAVTNKGTLFRTAMRDAKREDYNERIAVENPKPLQGTYRIIYADPPWKYIGLNGMDEHGHAEAHYDCLDDNQLCAYKPGNGTRLVKDVADKNAVLFMWVTSPLLERCFPIIKAWGFDYKSSFVWDKIKHNMGHYNSVRHELLLVCVKGACKPDVAKLVDSVQSIERQKHSQKPQEFYKIIEGLYDHGRKLELFSRNKREGWDMEGNEQASMKKAA